MKATFHDDVLGALRTRLKAAPGCPPDACLSLDNRDFTKPSGVVWVREKYVPSARKLQSLPAAQGRLRMDGTYFLDVFAPEGQGTRPATALVAALESAFAPNASFSYNGQVVTVVATTPSRSLNKDGWYMVPVTVRFYAYDINN